MNSNYDQYKSTIAAGKSVAYKDEDMEIGEQMSLQLDSERTKLKNQPSLFTSIGEADLIMRNNEMRDEIQLYGAEPGVLSRLKKEKEILEEELSKKDQLIAKLEDDKVKLKDLMKASDDVKTQQIGHLLHEVEMLKMEKDNSSIQCSTLSEESQTLKHQLDALIDTCQHMTKKLDLTEKRKHAQLAINCDECIILKQQNTELQNEGGRLSSLLKRVMQKNQEWQVFDKQRSLELENLQSEQVLNHQKISSLEERLAKSLSASNHQSGILPEQQQEIDRIFQGYKNRIKATEDEKLKIEDENRKLRIQAAELRDKNEELKSENQDLIHNIQHSTSTMSVNRERENALEAQIRLNMEDFRQERKDREKAQERCQELERDVSILRRQLEQFQGVHMRRLHDDRMSSLARYENQYNQRHAAALIARGTSVAADGDESDDSEAEQDESSYDTVDAVGMSVESGSTRNNMKVTSCLDTGSTLDNPDDTLKCPKCDKGYSIEEHNRFLEHIDQCDA